MDKIFIVLEEEDQRRLAELKTNQDPEEALKFIKEVFLPQFKEKYTPCFEGYQNYLR